MKIGWLPGDGIGIEVLEAARIVLDAVKFDADYVNGDIGWEFWKREGDALPKRTLGVLSNVDAAMFGAITSKPASVANNELDSHLKGKQYTYRSPIVRMRQIFDLYTCLRPCKAYSGNDLNFNDKIDITVFRENTEGLYAGVEFNPIPSELSELLLKISQSYSKFDGVNDLSMSCKITSRKGSYKIAKAAFEYAKLTGKNSVTAVHKANVVRATDGMFLDEVRRASEEYPEISLSEANIDALCMWLLKNPLNYQVLVAPNLYGDVVSDLCAQMVGGLGFACSGNIGKSLAVFEPTHGSAPKYAGQYKVNPIATILAAKMMLIWLGETEKADKIEEAVAHVIKDGKVKTYDMGGNDNTLEMAKAISEAI